MRAESSIFHGLTYKIKLNALKIYKKLFIRPIKKNLAYRNETSEGKRRKILRPSAVKKRGEECGKLREKQRDFTSCRPSVVTGVLRWVCREAVSCASPLSCAGSGGNASPCSCASSRGETGDL
jgi:hypothetical protein